VQVITVTPQLQRVIDRAYPGLPPRQQANKVRDLLFDVLLGMAEKTPAADVPPMPAATRAEAATKIANRIAKMAPAIDDQNWVKLEAFIEQAKMAGLWDNPAELRLVARLNDPFDGAENEHRVQNSRITAYFRRLAA
jgi:hypothetical protein